MSKFIPTLVGSYVNTDRIIGFYIEQGRKMHEVKCYMENNFEDEEDREWTLMNQLENEEKAQEWLDTFMEKYGLCI
jgi:hypothetical protein